jgi:hypothetical protein
MEKCCRICGEMKPLVQYHRASTTRDGYRGECKTCFWAISAARYRADPERERARVRRWQRENADRHRANQRARRERPEVKAQEREAHLKRKFGITQEHYEQLLAAQGGGCAVCRKKPKPGRSLHVDHDHATGAVRGLLCFSDNAALGHLAEDEVRIDALLGYLLDHDPVAVAIGDIESVDIYETA